jgi:predicted ribosome quality control (RQC) complex YloA/Tae2 family protein
MEENVKTPAQLKAEQVKNSISKEVETKDIENVENVENVKVDLEKENEDLKNQIEEANKKIEETENAAVKLEEKIGKLTNTPVINTDVLKVDERKVPEPLDHDYFTITVTNKTLTFS